jgi:lactoylglutathione lyase/glyoxylase I family protein
MAPNHRLVPAILPRWQAIKCGAIAFLSGASTYSKVMITRLAHVCVHVSNINTAMDFYGKKLGLPVKFIFEKKGRLGGAYFEIGNSTFIEVFEVPDLKVVNTGIAHFCLETDDMDAFMRDMKSKGLACSDKKLGCDESWQTWLQDPDGNKFEVHEYTGKSYQRHGGTAEIDW